MLNCAAHLAPRARTTDTVLMRDLSRPLNPDASGYARIMAVFGAVAAHGPMTLDDTMALTGLPRSACWRCLTTLEAEGWLSRRLRDGAFRVTSTAQTQIGAPTQRPTFIEELLPHLAPLLRKSRVEADIAVLRPDGHLAIVETTRKADHAAEPFFASPLTLGVLMVRPADARLALVNMALQEAAPEDRQLVTSGRFTRALAQAAVKGEIWTPAEATLTVPLEDPGQATAALRLEGQGSTKRSENRLRALIMVLRTACPELFPTPDVVLNRHWPTRRGAQTTAK